MVDKLNITLRFLLSIEIIKHTTKQATKMFGNNSRTQKRSLKVINN